MEKPKESGKQTAKKIIKKYDKIRREKAYQKLVDTREKKKKQRNIEIVDEIKDAAAKKNNRIVAKKILDKYKTTFLVDEEDLETIAYDEPEEEIFRGESIVEAEIKFLTLKSLKSNKKLPLKILMKKP